jgi:hypothetical protein
VYVNAVKEFFNGKISLDPCSNEYSIVNAEVEYILPQNDGLKESWNFKTIYVNPPYGSDKIRKTTIKDWLKKCYLANKDYGSEVIALVPVATNTGHWKNYVYNKATGLCFLYDTRLKFLENGKDVGKEANKADESIKDEKSFKEYAEKKFEKVFGDKLDKKKMNETIEGILKDNKDAVEKGDWGELVGILNKSFGK